MESYYFYSKLKELQPRPDITRLVLDMHTPDNALFDNTQLEILANLLCHQLARSYAPSWTLHGHSPALTMGIEAMRYPAFLLVWAEWHGFPMLLFACEQIEPIPELVVFGSERVISRALGRPRRNHVVTRSGQTQQE